MPKTGRARNRYFWTRIGFDSVKRGFEPQVTKSPLINSWIKEGEALAHAGKTRIPR